MLVMSVMAFFAVYSGPFKSIAAARNNTEEVHEIEPGKFLSQSNHSRKLRPRQTRIELPPVTDVENPAAFREFIEARLSFWLHPPDLLRAPPVLS